MDAGLTQTALAQRYAAAHAVAGALVPKGAGGTVKSAAATGAATGATGGTTSATSPAAAAGTSTITSSDFLTLLVNELKNQDPTQPTDPNAYITQLAQVNSLEQLISINSGISTLDSALPKPTTSKPGISTPGISAADLQPATAPATASQVHKQVSGAAAR